MFNIYIVLHLGLKTFEININFAEAYIIRQTYKLFFKNMKTQKLKIEWKSSLILISRKEN